MEMNSVFITQLEPPPLHYYQYHRKNPEPPESEIMENGMDDNIFNTSDSKDIDIVSHTLCEGLIKSETISENILETVVVKTENVKIENIIESENLIKTEDTSDDNGQEVVEVQETDEQQVLKFSNDLNDISVRSPKLDHPEKIDFADCRTHETTSLEEIKAKIKVIKAPVIPVKSHEYITLAENKHICNHCQLTSKKLKTLKAHIRRKHREVVTMYQCLYCSFKSKWRLSVREHIHKHKGRDNLQYCCDKCNYKTCRPDNLKNHKIIHLKPEEILYCYCYHCSFKSKHKGHLKTHILRHFQKEEIKFHCYICDFTTLTRDMIIKHLKRHFKHHTKSDEAKRKYQLENYTEIRYHYCDYCYYKTDRSTNLKSHKIIHLKPEEIEYFYCYHCSYKSKRKMNLKNHIFRHHFKNVKQGKRYGCNKCDYETYTSTQMKMHKLNHLKPEEIQYFYCYHCSYKSNRKDHLQRHIFKHSKNEEVKFDCYICNFMTQKRKSIIEHIEKHSKVQIKFEINDGS